MLDQQMSGLLPVARGFCLFLCLILGTAVCLSQAYRSGDVRLVGGNDKYEGTVLVMSRGVWKSVCGLGWDVLDASVVCRQLGFRGIRRFFRWSKFGEGNCKYGYTFILLFLFFFFSIQCSYIFIRLNFLSKHITKHKCLNEQIDELTDW